MILSCENETFQGVEEEKILGKQKRLEKTRKNFV